MAACLPWPALIPPSSLYLPVWGEENPPTSYPKPQMVLFGTEIWVQLARTQRGWLLLSPSTDFWFRRESAPFYKSVLFFFFLILSREWGGVRSATVKPLISGFFGFKAGVGGQQRALFALMCVCGERQARQGGEAGPFSDKVQGLHLTSVPYDACSCTHTLMPITCLRAESRQASSLSWPGPGTRFPPLYGLTVQGPTELLSRWALRPDFPPKSHNPLVGSQLLSWPLQSVWQPCPTHLTAMARGPLCN